MEDIIVAILSMLLVFALVPLYLWRRRLDSRSPSQPEEEPPQVYSPLKFFSYENCSFVGCSKFLFVKLMMRSCVFFFFLLFF